MATFTAGAAKGKHPFPGLGVGSQELRVKGWINIAANPADGDIYQMCNIPDGALITHGVWMGSDIDTGTEALDIDLGWAANGTSSAATRVALDGTEYTDSGNAADPDGFVNGGVLTGDAVTDLMAAGTFYRPIILGKPLYFAKKTMCQMEANAAANAFAAGNIQVILYGEIIG